MRWLSVLVHLHSARLNPMMREIHLRAYDNRLSQLDARQMDKLGEQWYERISKIRW